MMGAEGQLLVPEEGIRTKAHTGEHEHDRKAHNDLPRFGALARGNARTSCMSDHIEPKEGSYSDAPRAVCLSCSKYVAKYR